MPTRSKSTHNAITLRRAKSDDISIIQNLAHSIWQMHYIPIIGAKQAHYMLDMMYSSAALFKQFEQQHVFYLIEHEVNQVVGFISVEQLHEGHFKIHKFYILMSSANCGIGSTVFKRLCKLFNAREITLTVNRQNYKSINFYFKNGFHITAVADFDIGNGFVMNDFIMQWKK